jgi:ABC-type transport system substrate-binding protein
MLKLGRRGKWALVVIGPVLALFLELMSGQAPAKDVKELRIGIGIDADTLNPYEITTAIPANIAELIHGKMISPGPGGKLEPNMAREWTVTPDGLTWTIKLNKGITFSDGTPLNAQALKFNFGLVQNPKVRMPFRFLYAPIKDATVVDDYTIQYHLKAPFAPFAQLISVTLPVSPKAAEPYDGNKLSRTPVGAGPYKLAEWVKGERIVLVRNENFWGKKPTVEKITFMVVPETATRVAMLRSGQLDIAYSPTPADVPALQADSKITVVRPLSTRMIYVGINTQKGLTTDKRIRQAFNFAVDKKTITDRILFGVAKPLDAPFPPSIFGHATMVQQYDYNPEKAKALLREANFPKDAVIKMVTPNGRYLYDKQVAEAIQAYLADIGVKVELRTYDWPTFMALTTQPLNKTEIELYFSGWGWPYYDADGFLFMYFSSFLHPPNGLNSTFYTNAEYDKLVATARSIMDPAKRQELYQQASTLLWEDAAGIWLYVEPFSIAYQAKFKGLEVQPNERMYPTYVTTD